MNARSCLLSFVVSALVVSVFAARPGGYHNAGDADEVKAAAEFAVKEEGMRSGAPLVLQEVIQAEKQIVAGTNYRLLLRMQKNGQNSRAKAIVFRGLDQHYELKTWDWIDGK